MVVAIAISCASSNAQALDRRPVCKLVEAGLEFNAQLLRTRGLLTGYELRIENKSKLPVAFDRPALDAEAAGVIVFEKSAATLGDQIGRERIYPMHGPADQQQRWALGRIVPGGRMTLRVNMSDALEVGMRIVPTTRYDIHINPVMYFQPRGGYDEAATRVLAKALAKMSYSNCLSWFDVPGAVAP